MKIVVIGDTHDNIANIKHVMGFARKIKAGAVIHAGDWCHLKSFETVKEYNIPIYSVVGNGDIDPEIAKMFKEKEEIILDSVRIGIVHGPREIKKYFNNNKADIIFYGHVRSQSDETINKARAVRPGSLENDINFAVFDTKSKKVEFINF
jgi:putative phosphoesterase